MKKGRGGREGEAREREGGEGGREEGGREGGRERERDRERDRERERQRERERWREMQRESDDSNERKRIPSTLSWMTAWSRDWTYFSNPFLGKCRTSFSPNPHGSHDCQLCSASLGGCWWPASQIKLSMHNVRSRRCSR